MSVGDPTCIHGRYLGLCAECANGNFLLPSFRSPSNFPFWGSFDSFDSFTPSEPPPLSSQVKDLEDKLKKSTDELQIYKNMHQHEPQFHNCQSYTGCIRPYPQIVCSCCHCETDDERERSTFDAIQEIQNLRTKTQKQSDAILRIQNLVQTTDVLSAKDKVEILHLCKQG